MRVCSRCGIASSEESGRFCPDCGAEIQTTAQVAASLVGTTIGSEFRIDAVLGGGAFGTVYRACQLGLDRPCAIKIPTHEIAADPVMAKRFAREARAASRVTHPGVVAIYAVGELPDGRPYLAMQLVEGKPLDASIADGPLPPLRALRIARSIASALTDTHAADVVHRDLKPTNIIWRRDRNGDDRVVLVDFGIAAAKPGTAEATRLTQGGGLIGTPHYMSPEQAHGEQVDARADLYALGCVLFELVTGKTPFDGSAVEVMLAHLGRPAPAPSELEARVPEAVDRLCARLLAKKPSDRPDSAEAVVAMIDAIIRDLEAGRSSARSSFRGSLTPKRTLATRNELPLLNERPRRVPRWLAITGALGILLVGAGFGAFVIHGSTADAGRAEPNDQPNGPTKAGAGRRDIFRDNGEMILHVLVPDPITTGTEIRPHLEITNKLGQPVVTDDVVVTLTDDAGVARGLHALPHGDGHGHYDFHYSFPAPGHYLMRVFPPSIDSAFEIDLDVK